VYAIVGCGGGSSHHTVAKPTTLLVASLSGWRLPAPVSNAVVVASGGELYVAGGLTSGGASASGIFRVDPASGRTTPAGALLQPTHDAAGVMLGRTAYVVGGGSSAASDTVQSFVPGTRASLAGRLPQARADLVSTVAGNRAYVVGGYDGRTPIPAVLATSDGRRFTRVADLPDPVRYPAVAALGGSLYAFGGETASGGDSNAIQRIDPSTGSARVVGRLPTGVSHAAAVVLGGTVYIAGGRTAGRATDKIWRFQPKTNSVSPSGTLPVAVSDAGAATIGRSGYLVGGQGRHPLATVVVLRIVTRSPAARRANSGKAATPVRPAFTGKLLIADRGNNRLLLVDAAKRVYWRYPSPTARAPRGGFYFPDDAFFVRGGRAIISNEEDNHTIVQIGFPSGGIEWSYGHPRAAGSAPGYLAQPDDAYLLRDGSVTVADARNCRILFIGADRRPKGKIGSDGVCAHHPPRTLAYPNGDTPLADGNVLVSEVYGSYVDEITPGGHLRWSVHLPIAYPSDPQQLGPDLYLVADYARPGGLYEFDRAGRILWSYRPHGGPRMLDHPSLAERLPNGLIAVNDDYRDRVAVIDPRTKQIVWQYGRTDAPGRGADRLKTPDGFDLLVGRTTPTHPQTG
jgi:hypothetical protein